MTSSTEATARRHYSEMWEGHGVMALGHDLTVFNAPGLYGTVEELTQRGAVVFLLGKTGDGYAGVGVITRGLNDILSLTSVSRAGVRRTETSITGVSDVEVGEPITFTNERGLRGVTSHPISSIVLIDGPQRSDRYRDDLSEHLVPIADVLAPYYPDLAQAAGPALTQMLR